MPSPTPWIRPHIHALHPYAPGEQPSGTKLIKLNTNENPYGPSPKVLKSLTQAVSDQLRLYPHPTADPLRDQLASQHHCKRDEIIVGNGSDELLALATRAFVAPTDSTKKKQSARSVIQYFTPSYSLYPVLAAIQNTTANEVPLTPSFGIPSPKHLAKTNWNPRAALTFVTTPNAPSGRPYRTSELRRLCAQTKGVIILDEAYVDFADENAMELASEFNHVLISRTFSKAYSLCFQRIGYFVGPAPLISALHKLRDSYNVNGLAQVAAEATLNDLGYYRRNFKTVIRERAKLSQSLTSLGFKTTPSAANFILVIPPAKTDNAEKWYLRLRDNGILVRWFSDSRVSQYLRITIGTPQHNKVLVKTIKQILKTSL